MAENDNSGAGGETEDVIVTIATLLFELRVCSAAVQIGLKRLTLLESGNASELAALKRFADQTADALREIERQLAKKLPIRGLRLVKGDEV